jgi:serine/threonine-protein kinase
MKNCPTCHLTYPNSFTLCPHDGGTLQLAGEWTSNTIIREKYRVLGRIGAGGMATVYKAEHVHFREIRALKVMSLELCGDDGFVRRFMQEAVLTRRLQHPNAVRVDDIEKAEDGRPFIVMEFIDGISLREAMQPGVPLPVDQACRIAREVGSALDAAHKLGMVHRDIKPANIFLANTAQGQQAKVLDFGIAKIKESRLEETRMANLTMTGTGMVIGTPAYMSPEQAEGKRGDELDGRSDIYSLGVVFYQMLTGDLPLNADSDLQLMMAHLAKEPVPIGQLRPDLPPPLSDLVMRCLAKDRDKRPNNALEFVHVLQGCEALLGVSEPAFASAAPVSQIPTQTAPKPATGTISKQTPAPQTPAPIPTPAPATHPSHVVNYATAVETQKRATSGSNKKFVAAAVAVVALMGLAALGAWSRLARQRAASQQTTAVVVPAPVNPLPAPIVPPNPTPVQAPQEDKPDPSDTDPPDTPPADQPVRNTPIKRVAPPVKVQVPIPEQKTGDPKTGDPKTVAQAKVEQPPEMPPVKTTETPQNSSGSAPALSTNDPWAKYAGGSNPSGSGNAADNSGGGNSQGNAGPGNGMQGQVFHIGAGVTSPVVIAKVEPKYSQEARSFRASGTSVLSAVVDERGIISNIQVVRAVGYGLDQQAIAALKNWRFQPGFRNGAPVRVQITVGVSFHYAGLFSFAKASIYP